MNVSVEICDDISGIDTTKWSALTKGDVFASHAFLCALKKSKSTGKNSGWQDVHLVAKCEDEIVGLLPLWLKGSVAKF